MTVFVTRELGPASVLRYRLEAAGHHVRGYSLLAFETVTIAPLPACDWLFAYSPRGVQALHKQGRVPPGAQLAAMGEGTAAAWREAGYTVDFTGVGSPDGVAAAFLERARGATVVFAQAAESRASVQARLVDAIQVVPVVVYRNAINPDREVPDADLYVLTSPLNARAVLGSRSPEAPPRTLCIGATTAGEIRRLGFGESPHPDRPREEDLAEAALSLLTAGPTQRRG